MAKATITYDVLQGLSCRTPFDKLSQAGSLIYA
jgi:hypothetical protein